MDFKKVLNLIGYNYNDYSNTIINISYSLDNNNNISEIKRDEVRRVKLNKFYSITHLLIFACIVSWSSIFSAFHSIKEGESLYLGHSAFTILIAVQYLVGLNYFNRKRHFSEIINNNPVLNKKYNKLINISVIIAIGISILTVTSFVFSSGVRVYNTLYTEYGVPQGLLICLLSLESIIGYVSYLVNLTTFAITMFYHKNFIKDYSRGVDECIKSPTDISAKISRISGEFPLIKSKYEKSVSALNSFFIAQNFLGLVGCFYLVKSLRAGDLFPNDIFSMLFFIITEGIYIHSIQRVRRSVYSVKAYLLSPQFLNAIIRPNGGEKKIELLNNQEHVEKISGAVNQLLVLSSSTDEAINWIIFQNVLNQKWSNFTVLGMHIDDTSIIHKMIGIIGTYILAQDVAELLQF